MKTYSFALALAVSALVACTINSEISDDPRLSPLIGTQLVTKVPLRLYAISYQRSGNSDFCELTKVNYGEDDLIGMVTVGSKVRFERAMKLSGGGGVWERFEGHFNYKDKSYPIEYNLGLTAYPDGWRRVHDVFQEAKK